MQIEMFIVNGFELVSWFELNIRYSYFDTLHGVFITFFFVEL